MSIAVTVAERVKERLGILSMNAAEAARLAGLERTFVHDLLTGRKKTVAAEALISLADALSCSPEYLVGKSDNTVRSEASISGIIEPGVWRDYRKIASLPIARVTLIDGATEAFLARGSTAASLGIIDGTIVLISDHLDLVVPGEAYVVRRVLGELEELSIRILRRTNDSFALYLPIVDDLDPITPTDPNLTVVGKIVKAITLFNKLS